LVFFFFIFEFVPELEIHFLLMHEIAEAACVDAQHLLHLLDFPAFFTLALNDELFFFGELPIKPIPFMFGLIPQSIVLLTEQLHLGSQYSLIFSGPLLTNS
jgi:hypothetical protein